MLTFSANLSFLYAEHAFLDRFAAAAADGFRAVEYLSPYEHPPEVLAERLAEHGLVQALFNMPMGRWDDGERGIACLPDRREQFEADVATAIRYAQALGCRRVHCPAGIDPPGVAPEATEAAYLANLRYALPRFAEAGIRLLIEPINTGDIPGFHLSSIAHAERVLDAVGSPDLWLQFDIYHAQVMGAALVPTFERLRDRIAHIQIADTPGRHEPGTGEIDYGVVLPRIDRLGYDGYVGCEYVPLAGTSAGLGWMAAYR